jgi:para-nitrobenzyl esterase
MRQYGENLVGAGREANLKRCAIYLISGLLVVTSCSKDLADTARIDSGLISGTLDGNVRVYRGIPFAAPPVGDRRWRPPQPVAPWEGIRECIEFGSSCLYVPYPAGSLWTGPEWDDPAEQSEDCLHLNVWTAAASPEERRPVMVWIHGGSLKSESGSIGAYGGAVLARKGVVVVTINYRLGPFGFLAHPELTRESEHASSGNYGVLDQIAALEWLQRNIEAFGGDPDNVTIFGESAGSWSVNFLVASPLAAGLFHRAIGQSGAGFGPMTHLTENRSGRASAEQTGLLLAAELGTDDGPASLAKMRTTPAEEILATFHAMEDSRTGPTVDGWVFPASIQSIFEKGRQSRVPVIVGSNADEGSIYVGEEAPATLEEFRSLAEHSFGDHADEFLKVYAVEKDADVRPAYSAFIGDSWFGCQMRTWARMTAASGSKAWLYRFTRVPPIADSENYGSHHGAEIVYVIGNFHLASFTPQIEDLRLAETMSGYWVRFATAGDPNGEGLPEWPAYDLENEAHMIFGDTLSIGNHLLDEQCDFFDSISTAQRRAR